MAKTQSLSEKSRMWLDNVSNGKLTMSQRSVRLLEKNDGSLMPIIKAALERDLHLIQLKDDYGNDLVLASKSLFKTLC
ncbi:hypothetical protein [Mucilaginibacter ginkgonis]|uniref:Uncharacterized protein n=1 Tax=Mucilaginibacter ginkgonis TaxID=2682091 RepID=A0A6I4HUF9_9SPHI|nr:hypothetical protein [Mucilaginibacter ginkgonis]QQL50176.1 hypothetical protein GO620_001610 [Mucilaginibacter ginkgonis]